MSSLQYKINSLGHIVLNSANGQVQINSEVVHNHANDSLIADLKGLKSSLNANETVKWNGSNLVAEPLSNYATASALSDLSDVVSGKASASSVSDLTTTVNGKVDQGDFDTLETAVGTKASQSSVDNLSTDLTNLSDTVDLKLNSSDQYISSASAPFSVTAGALSIDLNDYVTQAQLTSATFISSVDASVPELSVDGSGELTVDLSAYAKTADIADFVDATELATELANYASSASLADKLATADLGTEIQNLSTVQLGNDSVLRQNGHRQLAKKVNFNSSFAEALSLSTSNSMSYFVNVKANYRNSDLSKCGAVSYSAVFKRESGTSTLIEESAQSYGDCTAEEIQVINSSGSLSVQVKGNTAMSSGEVSVFAEWLEC